MENKDTKGIRARCESSPPVHYYYDTSFLLRSDDRCTVMQEGYFLTKNQPLLTHGVPAEDVG